MEGVQSCRRLHEEDSGHPFQQHIKQVKEKLAIKNDYLPYDAAESILEKIFGEYNNTHHQA